MNPHSEAVIHIDRTHLDWLSLSSWSPALMYWHSARVDLGIPAKFRGYTALLSDFPNGTRWAGAGEQNGTSHYRMEATGYMAHQTAIDLLETIKTTGIDCHATRLDIARTVVTPIPQGDGHQQWYRLLHDAVEGSQPMLIESPTGLTLYIGAPSSDRRIRIYDKDVTEEGYHVIRFEVQFRRDIARGLWRDIQYKGLGILDAMLNAELDRRGDLGRCIDWWRPDGIDRHRTRPFERPDGRKKWLMTTLIPWLEREGNADDIGREVRRRIRAVVRAWDDQERDDYDARAGLSAMMGDLWDKP